MRPTPYQTPKLPLATLAKAGFAKADCDMLATFDTEPRDHFLSLTEIATVLALTPRQEVIGRLFSKSFADLALHREATRLFEGLVPSQQINVLKLVDGETQTRLLESLLAGRGEQGWNDLAILFKNLSAEDANGRFGGILLLGLQKNVRHIKRLFDNPYLRTDVAGRTYLRTCLHYASKVSDDLQSGRILTVNYVPNKEATELQVDTVRPQAGLCTLLQSYELAFYKKTAGGLVVTQKSPQGCDHHFVPSIFLSRKPESVQQPNYISTQDNEKALRHKKNSEAIEAIFAAIPRRCNPELLQSTSTRDLRLLLQAKLDLGGDEMEQDAIAIYQEVIKRDPNDPTEQMALDKLQAKQH